MDEEAAGFLLERFPFLADEWCNANLSEEDIDRLFDLLSTLRLPTKPTVSIRGLSVETIEALVDSGETLDKDELAELPAETLYRLFVKVSQPLAT